MLCRLLGSARACFTCTLVEAMPTAEPDGDRNFVGIHIALGLHFMIGIFVKFFHGFDLRSMHRARARLHVQSQTIISIVIRDDYLSSKAE